MDITVSVSEPQTRLPLTGVTVVAFEQAVAAPYCTRLLADLGARVIKVENPRGGDFARHYDDVVHGQAAHFVWANRGKESIKIFQENGTVAPGPVEMTWVADDLRQQALQLLGPYK